jgi:hypothetical protein
MPDLMVGLPDSVVGIVRNPSELPYIKGESDAG